MPLEYHCLLLDFVLACSCPEPGGGSEGGGPELSGGSEGGVSELNGGSELSGR